jgi:two-component system C4-dicarboxylate transport sensor histidine kinase DctB
MSGSRAPVAGLREARFAVKKNGGKGATRDAWATRRARFMLAVALALLMAAGAWLAYRYAEQVEIRALRDTAARRLDGYENALTSEVRRYSYLPSLVSLNTDVLSMLRNPAEPRVVARVNDYLQTVNADAGSDAFYVMDTRGNTLASSNWNQPKTFVGSNFSFRPYFIGAMRDGHGSFYGLGTVSKEPGYFLAERIYDHVHQVLGVVTLKIDLDRIDSVWRQGAEPVFAADSHGVIFLSSVPGLKYRTLQALTAVSRAEIVRTHQYDAPGALAPAGFHVVRTLAPNVRIESVARGNPLAASLPTPRPFPTEFLVVTRPVSGTDWQIAVLSNLAPAKAVARSVARTAALVIALLAVLVLTVLQRRRIVAQRFALREALQQLNEGLERKVVRRTAALSRANRNLKHEIAMHKETEAQLKAAFDELVQAGKMAALGQMAASITHELNQPLAALRTLSDNALTFLERGRASNAEANLRMIGDLIERMGNITSQLKRFARKTPMQLQPVVTGEAIDNALFLVEQRLCKERVKLTFDRQHADARVLADANRLEQVLVNLFANALDAMGGASERHLEVMVEDDGYVTVIRVRDTGTGLPEAVRARLFEPFFTTKEQGAGLGLGLAISAGIVREFRGALKAADRSGGGAEFSIHLCTDREGNL